MFIDPVPGFSLIDLQRLRGFLRGILKRDVDLTTRDSLQRSRNHRSSSRRSKSSDSTRVDHFITDVLGEVTFLRTNMRGVDLEANSGNPVLRRAVKRSIQIISEAARKLPADATAKHPDILKGDS